jgi:two-component SAPR family response regulator
MKNQSVVLAGLVLLLLFSNKAFSQNLYHAGLLFTAAPQAKEQRTSLDLTPDSPITVRNKFHLEFDFAIWGRDQFGYIFRVFDKQHHNIDLVYIPKSSTLAVLKLVINGKPTRINLALNEKELIRNNWLHLILTFDLANGKVECKLGDSNFTDDNIDLTGFRRLNFSFGANRSIYFPTTDVPNMAIRNIRITDDKNKQRHNWLLNESEGVTASDLVGNFTAHIANPYWLINNHFFWTKKGELKLEASSGVACDTMQNRIVFVGKNKIVSYDIVSSEKSEQQVSNTKPSNLKSESYYYSFPDKKIYCIGPIPNQVSVFNEANNEWGKGAVGTENSQCINSTFFMNDQEGSVFSIGGYRNYRYFDILMRYNFQDKSWNQVLLQGDKLAPRSYASVTKTRLPGEYFIFGGYGNASGQQELGPQCLYDLYRLNLNTSVLEKMWNMESVSENFIPMGSTTAADHDPALYVLGFPPFLNGTYLKLYRISLEKPGYSVVSDTIHFYFDEERSKASLFFFRKTQEFFAVIKTQMGRDSVNYKIFSLNYPPVNRSMITVAFKTVLLNQISWITAIYWMIGILSSILIFVLVILLRRLHLAEESLEEDRKMDSIADRRTPIKNEHPETKIKIELPQKNAIYLFGDFRVYDNEGVDISHQFSAKLRQLFLSILFMGTDDRGVTNEKLNSIHWMYHSPQSAKNNRNVNIKKLRDLLSSLKGVQVIHTEGSWMLKLSTEVFCDYHFLVKRMKGNYQQLSREEFEKIILILSEGIFVADERTPWLEPFNSHFLTSLLDYLFLLTNSFEKDKNPEAIHRLADLILKSDPLNEEAFKLKIEALVKQKNHNQAFFDYEYFTKGYEKMYGISFPISFKSFIRKDD